MSQEKASFLDRFIERLDTIDSNSLQAYIVHLFRERGFFESVFNAIHEGILVIDKHLSIKYFNSAARNLLGLPEDFRKLKIIKLLPQLDWRGILGGDIDSWTRLARQEIEIAYPVHRWLQVYIVPQEEGSERFATIILHDVTERRKQTDEELESRTAGVVGIISHVDALAETIPAQLLAQEYTAEIGSKYIMPLRLCGHSKGGNLAVFAAVKAEESIRNRIREIYNHDGPGFTAFVMEDPAYKEIAPRTRTIVPQSSVIGMLLEHEEPYTIIRSKQIGLLQHDPYSWDILGPNFVPKETPAITLDFYVAFNV